MHASQPVAEGGTASIVFLLHFHCIFLGIFLYLFSIFIVSFLFFHCTCIECQLILKRTLILVCHINNRLLGAMPSNCVQNTVVVGEIKSQQKKYNCSWRNTIVAGEIHLQLENYDFSWQNTIILIAGEIQLQLEKYNCILRYTIVTGEIQLQLAVELYIL